MNQDMLNKGRTKCLLGKTNNCKDHMVCKNSLVQKDLAFQKTQMNLIEPSPQEAETAGDRDFSLWNT